MQKTQQSHSTGTNVGHSATTKDASTTSSNTATGVAATIYSEGTGSVMNEWCARRRIDQQLLRDLGARGVVMKDNKGEDRPWVGIPVTVGGDRLGVKFRTIDEGPKDFKWSKKERAEFFGADALLRAAREPEWAKGRTLVVCEGEPDWLSVLTLRPEKADVVCLPDGWAEGLTVDDGAERFKMLNRHVKAFTNYGRVVCLQHHDKTGLSWLRAFEYAYPDARLYAAKWPEGCNDANDVLVLHGEATLRAVIKSAAVFGTDGARLHQFDEDTDTVPRTTYKPGNWADEYIGLKTGSVSVLTGPPGVGKTTFARWLAWKMVQNHPNLNVCYAPFETDSDEMLDGLSKIANGLSFDKLPPDQQKDFRVRLKRNFCLLEKADFQVSKLEDQNYDIGWLEANIRRAAIAFGVKLFVVDPWNELDHNPNPGENMTLYIRRAVRFLRELAAELDIHIMLVAHPKKPQGSNHYKTEGPTGYDIADSAEFFNKVGQGMTIFMDKNGQLWFVCWKVRNVAKQECHRGRERITFVPETEEYYQTASDMVTFLSQKDGPQKG